MPSSLYAQIQRMATQHHLRIGKFEIGCAVLILLLLLKYFWTYFAMDYPLGFDAGIYRYLFLKHAQGFPPFLIAPMDSWALEHPLGLFFFSTILIKLGLPVDALIGWVWNLVPVAGALVLSFVTLRLYGRAAAFFALLLTILSVAQYQAFLLMYWKTYLALIFIALAFYFLKDGSWYAALFGMLAFATHHQTGLLLGLTYLVWLILEAFHRHSSYRQPQAFILIASGTIVGLLWYLPVWTTAVLPHLHHLLDGSALPGTFQSPGFFLAYSGILLLIGVAGFFWTLRKEHLSIWHVAAVISLLAVSARILFYRRFFLHLDFFLIPFGGYVLAYFWNAKKKVLGRSVIIIVLAVQTIATCSAVAPDTFSLWCSLVPPICKQFPINPPHPTIERSTFASIHALQETPRDTLILALEPETAPWIRGLLPEHRVAGPGVFDSPWNYDEWEAFLLGSSKERKAVLKTVRGPVLLIVTPQFLDFYSADVQRFLRDPCFQKMKDAHILAVAPSCTSS